MHENRLPDIHVLLHIWNEMYIAGEKMYQHTKHHGLLHAFSDIHLKKGKSTGHLLHEFLRVNLRKAEIYDALNAESQAENKGYGYERHNLAYLLHILH